MKRYFVCYIPYVKAYIDIDGSPTVQDFMVTLLNKDFWTEASWLEYWLYRIF